MVALSMRLVALLACWVVLVVPLAAVAQRVPALEIREARELLREYQEVDALEAIRRLTRLLATEGSRLGPHDTNEARFLRATTAADLLLLSGVAGFSDLTAKVAKALEVPPADVRGHLDAELQALEFGRFRPIAEEIRAALAAQARERDLEANGRPRIDFQWLSSVAASLEAEEPVEALARLVRDPCEPGPCEETLHALSPRSRRALVAFQRGLVAAARLDMAADFGDPFTRAAEPEIEVLAAKLVDARLPLRPRAEPGVGRLDGQGTADVFVTVTEKAFVVQSTVVYGLERGAVRPVSSDACGRRLEIPLPSSFASRIGAVAELVRALPKGCGRTVAVAAEDTAEAHLLLRAFESIRSAGLELAGLAGLSAAGELVVRAAALAHAAKDAWVEIVGEHIEIGRGAGRIQLALSALTAPELGAELVAKVGRALASLPSGNPLRIGGSVPFAAVRVILQVAPVTSPAAH